MASDTFDGSGALGGSWTKRSGTGTLTQSGGELTASATNDAIAYYYSGAASGDAQRSKITIVDALNDGAVSYWTAECNASGSNEYQFTVTHDHWYLTKNGTDVADGSGSFSGAVTPLDIELTVEVSGANRELKGYVGGALTGSYTDTSAVNTGGQPGMAVYVGTGVTTNPAITSWEGGDFGSAQSQAPRSMTLFRQMGV